MRSARATPSVPLDPAVVNRATVPFLRRENVERGQRARKRVFHRCDLFFSCTYRELHRFSDRTRSNPHRSFAYIRRFTRFPFFFFFLRTPTFWYKTLARSSLLDLDVNEFTRSLGRITFNYTLLDPLLKNFRPRTGLETIRTVSSFDGSLSGRNKLRDDDDRCANFEFSRWVIIHSNGISFAETVGRNHSVALRRRKIGPEECFSELEARE